MKKSIAAALVCLVFAWFGPRAHAQEATSPTAPEMIAKVVAKYAGLTSLATSGRVITDIDTSGGKDAAAAPKAGALSWDPAQPGTVTLFNVRLAKPDWYRIEWSQAVTASYTNKGAVWSSGNGDFIFLAGKKRSVEGGMVMALASATGVSGGVAFTLPPVFFHHRTNELQSLGHLALLPEEKIGEEVCYVVSGDLTSGQKLILWITKDYWLRQKRMVLGGEMKMPDMSDDDIKKAMATLGQEATPEAVARMRDMMKSAKAMSSSMKGSITEKYETTQANPSVTKESFDYQPD